MRSQSIQNNPRYPNYLRELSRVYEINLKFYAPNPQLKFIADTGFILNASIMILI